MNITIEETTDQTILRLAGDETTHESIDGFKRAIELVTQQAPLKPLVLDLSQLFYLGSEGVGVIATTHKFYLEHKSQMIVKNPTRQVSRVLMVTRLDAFLEIQRDAEAPDASAAPKS
jgi:anti-anti-sigma factor